MPDVTSSGPDGGSAGGAFVLVLHTHLPWLKCAGRWPVGEEWLFQAWGEAYLPVLDVLDRQADAGRRNMCTLGLTPLILEQMNDPELLARFHDWLGHALLRCRMLADNAAQFPDARERRAAAAHWWQHYSRLLDSFERRDRQLVPSFRRLAEDGVIEVLGGPLTHPYLPLHEPDTVRVQMRLGLDRSEDLLGVRPRGVWLPECAYRPGLETELERCGVGHVLLDGPTVLQAGGFPAVRRAWSLRDSTVACAGRDLELSYRVWSPTGGYPGHGAYREYHRWEYETGLKLWRVTDRSVDQADKEYYDVSIVPEALDAHVDNFAHLVRQSVMHDDDLVVACYDTELFGHWWLEGPQFLDRLFDELYDDPAAPLTTLAAYLHDAGTAGTLEPPPGSWGLRKDFSIWDNDATAGMWTTLQGLHRRMRDELTSPPATRSDAIAGLDERLRVQAARELFLAQSSDWPFMIGHDKSVDYAHERFNAHAEACKGLLDALHTLRDGSFDGTGEEFTSWLARLEHEHGIAPDLTARRLAEAWT